MMFGAFQNNGRHWDRIDQAKTHGRDAWLYCFIVLVDDDDGLDVSYSGISFGNVN